MCRHVALLLILTALMPLPGVVQAAASDDVQAIEALFADWREAVETGDIPAYVAVLHPEVRLLPPGADPIVGADAYARFLEPVFAAADYRIEVLQPPAVDVLGDLAVAEYEYVIHLDLASDSAGIAEPGALTEARTHARYVDVLRRGADGRWLVWRHMWQEPAPGAE